MKKLLVLVLTIISAITMCFSVAGCGGNSNACEHKFATRWSYNATHHWKECTKGCGEKKDYEEHDFSVEGIENNNQPVYECSKCGISENLYGWFIKTQ